ncbi:MAG: DUF3857 domain-containing protein, partial [Planctomycetota bacterium]|nr:DUF3857 domain-containing protein [Planctomycetota bacterium]
ADLSGEGSQAAALAEYLLERYLRLVRQTSRFGEALQTLEDVFRRDAIDPILWGRVGLGLAETHLRLGDEKKAREVSDRLGFISDWLVCGAFENERGGGFDIAYPPEKEFLRDAVYGGKKRDVGWRRVPVIDPLGWVDLDAMLRPNEECLAYATTFVKSEKDQDAFLRVGSDEGLKVWCNGRLLLERDVHRKARRDQDGVGIALRKGWNQILIKVAERDGSWRFAARIHGADGHPLQGIQISTSPEEVPLADEGTETVTFKSGAMEMLRRRDGEEEDATDLFRLGFLHLSRQPGGEEDHTDRDLFKRAREIEPRNAVFAYYHARALREDEKYSIAKDHNEERKALEDAFSLDPKHALAAYRLARYYERSLGNTHKATIWLRRALKANPRFPEALLMEADLMVARGWSEEARRARHQIIDQGVESPASLQALARSHQAAGDFSAARAALDMAIQQDRTHIGIRTRLADLLSRVGETEKAVDSWREATRLRPFRIRSRTEIATLEDGLGDLDGAVATLRGALEIAPEDDDLHEWLGHILSRQGETEEALQVWRRALELNPNRVDLRRYLEFKVEEEAPFEDAHPFDASALVERARAESEEGNEPYRVLLRRVIVRVNRDGTRDEFRHEIFKIGNDEGARSFDSYWIPYTAGEQQVKVKLAQVIHRDGTVEEARIGRSRASRRSGEFSSQTSHRVDLPSLEPGDVVEVRYRRDDLAQSFFGDYFGDVFIFQDRVPVGRISYTLISPKEREFYVHLKNASIEPRVEGGNSDDLIRTWEMTDVAKLESESGRPPAQELSPQIHISTFEKWEELGEWYANLIRSQHEASDPIRQKVAELVAGRESIEEKVSAIYDFVVTEIRYNDAWEFGVHGYKPYKASTIFTRKFGDCKDKAILLNTMLKEIEIESRPVLIFSSRSRWEEDLTLPMFNHFNHCISYVTLPDRDEGIFLDGTAEYHPWDVIPFSDQGARVLVVEEGGGAIRQVPTTPAEENRMITRHEVELALDGSAKIRVEAEAKGTFAVILRAYLPIEERRVDDLERIYADTLPGTEVTSTRVGDLRLLVDPVRLEYELASPRFLKDTPQGSSLLSLDNPLFRYAYAASLSDLSSLAERKHDEILPQPIQIVDEVKISLPGDTEVVSIPEDRELSSPFGTYTSEARREGATIHFTRTLSIRSRRIPVDQYSEFRKFCNDVDRARREAVIIRIREGAQE